MKIRINPLTAVIVFVVSVMGNLGLYLITYAIMAIHELAHLIAAISIGLKPSSITFSPFGVHLKLENKIINSLADEIILYGAGPFVNVLFALSSLIFGYEDLYRLNTALFVMNILPISPLDGGMIAVRLISHKTGRRQAKRILSAISGVSATALLVIAVFMIYRGIINISLFLIAILLIGNILTAKELYNSDIISALTAQKKTSSKAKIVIADKNFGIEDAVKNLSPTYTTIVMKLEDNGEIADIISEQSLLNSLDIL